MVATGVSDTTVPSDDGDGRGGGTPAIPRRRRFLVAGGRTTITGMTVLAALAGAGWWLGGATEPAYATVSASVGAVERVVSATGRVRALKTVKVGAEASGQIVDVAVDFNSHVRAGEVLAVIEPTRSAARVSEAVGLLDAARAGVAEGRANRAAAIADLGLRRREHARRLELAAGGFVSRAQLEASEGALATAQAVIARSDAQIDGARALLSQRSAQLEAARNELAKTRIRSPIEGTIVNRLVDRGSTVAASFQTPNLFEIAADTRRMQVDALVDEADIGDVREGQVARLRVDSYPSSIFQGTVRQVRMAASEAQGIVSYVVVVDVDNPGRRLLPGMTTSIEIVTATELGAMRVPNSALRFQPSGSRKNKDPSIGDAIWIEDATTGRPVRRPVLLGVAGEDYTAVRRGLRKGDRVLVSVRARSTGQEDASR